ncbi:unnamed protein product [Phytophthora lilii]|uniref:Unnamed protein product n=1 Tax=Phytophthora lilii TaxID=2077276 RepID=A0A9W6TIY2_9STRA|nr:unnamed protein product [Phytophthora lilii]
MSKRFKSPNGPFHMQFDGLHAQIKSKHAKTRTVRSLLVSHLFVELWRIIEDDKSFDKTIFNQLSESERDFMAYALKRCKVESREFEKAYNLSIGHHIDRLNMIQSAIKIGNDAPELKTEMKQILDKLYDKGLYITIEKMSFPIMLNINNRVSQHQYRYTFSRPVDLSKFEIGLGSISMYYSWMAITAERGNNKFRIIWPTGTTTQTFTITIPDGTYEMKDLNNYLQWWSIQNNLYLTNSTTGANYYFISVAANPSSYDVQFTMQPYKAVSGYTAAAGALAFSTSGYTPQIQIVDSGTNSFSSIVGLSQGTYPPAQQATLYSVLSDLVPQIDPVSSVIVGVSNLQNPLASNNQVLHSFTSGFGGLITTSQGQGISYCPMQGTTNELLVSFYDDRMLPLKITDPNLCVRLLIRPKKSDIMDF